MRFIIATQNAVVNILFTITICSRVAKGFQKNACANNRPRGRQRVEKVPRTCLSSFSPAAKRTFGGSVHGRATE
jgi:hypothetical protein